MTHAAKQIHFVAGAGLPTQCTDEFAGRSA
jgi:hypothetical protein